MIASWKAWSMLRSTVEARATQRWLIRNMTRESMIKRCFWLLMNLIKWRKHSLYQWMLILWKKFMSHLKKRTKLHNLLKLGVWAKVNLTSSGLPIQRNMILQMTILSVIEETIPWRTNLILKILGIMEDINPLSKDLSLNLASLVTVHWPILRLVWIDPERSSKEPIKGGLEVEVLVEEAQEESLIVEVLVALLIRKWHRGRHPWSSIDLRTFLMDHHQFSKIRTLMVKRVYLRLYSKRILRLFRLALNFH